MKKRTLIYTAIVITSVLYYIYIPFIQFGKIWFDDKTINEQELFAFKERVYVYMKHLFLHKGKEYRQMPMTCFEDGTKDTISVKFNWDNTITIVASKDTNCLYVDSLCYQYASGIVNIDNKTFEGLDFYCNDGQVVYMYYKITDRKTKSVENKIGFVIPINNKFFLPQSIPHLTTNPLTTNQLSNKYYSN